MWWKSAVFLLLLSACAKSQEIGCNYVQRGGYPYTCQLTIVNPEGSDAFTSIPGQHLPNKTDADVQLIDAFSQNTLNIPSVICRQFPNLLDLYMAVNNIEIINEGSFEGCRLLRSATLVYNRINRVPANTFRNNPNLEFIYLSWNNVSELNQDSFTGSGALFIDLEFNNLGAMQGGLFRGSWFQSVNSTLQSLGLMGNNLRGIEVNGFINLRNIAWLDMTANPLLSVTNSAFEGLERIRDLYLISCELHSPRPEWFRNMRILEELHIELNGIRTLPRGIFENLDALTNIYLGYNNLTHVDLDYFGEAAFNIEVLSLLNNQINSIEPQLFDKLENVNSIEMGGNICSQLNLFNIQQERTRARVSLRRCFDNYGPRFINCQYRPIGGEYACTMTVRNAEGLDFDRVEGVHLSERVDEDVQMIYGSYQNTRNFPPVICRQFPAVTTIFFYSNYIEIITPESFANCQLLTFLNLDFNIIVEIPDNTFSRSPIRELYLGGNSIRRADFYAFNGTRIELLDLSNNEMYEFNPFVYEPINTTLRTLDFTNNRLGIMYSNTFANLRNIEYLLLSGNAFYNIPDDAFDGAVRLEYLAMSNCGLTQLVPRWYEGKPDLEVLYLGSNQLTEIPDGTFSPLTDLKEIYLYNNHLLELRAAQFGAAMRDIELIYAIGNRINSIDPAIVTTGEDLEYLFLQNNICADVNIYDVYDNPQDTLQRIQRCNQNFAATTRISCNYQTIGPDYICVLNIVNPLERQFESIEGTHVGELTDADVRVVNIIDQNTLNVPSVICTQFNGIIRMQLMTSFINVLSRDTFTNCSELQHVLAMSNNIPNLPGGLFEGLANLRVFIAPLNRIRTISSTTFSGTILENLDLERNELTTVDQSWFQPIGSTLRVLRLNDNRISDLSVDSFIRLWNLRELYLTNNPIRVMRHGIFDPLINVEVLHMAGCLLTELDPTYFYRSPMIVNIELANNQLQDLPVGVFNNTRLVHVGLTNNRLRAIDSLSFGNSLNTLRNLHFDLNQVEAVDMTILDDAPNLYALIAYQNECADFSAINIQGNRENVRNLFAQCFARYSNITASCDYEVFEGMYKCNLNLMNPQGRHRFDRITGEHIGNANDNFVSYVEAIDQFTKTIPSIVCQQFRFVEGITFTGSRVEFIAGDTFAGCEYLYSLSLMMNNIRIIPPIAFSHNMYLSSLRLDGNQLTFLPTELFYGTQIYNLHLSANQITSISPQLFEPIARNLIFLDLRSNRITQIPRHTFRGMTMMYELLLDGNNLGVIPSDSFHSMQWLGYLNIANCGLTTITALHFQEKPIMYRLEIDNNRFTYFQPNTFNMPSLTNLGIHGNQLEFLDSASFGASLGSLLNLGAHENRIRGIDVQMITRTIFGIDLVGNICANSYFLDIQNNRQNVLNYLDTCFLNFRRRNDALSCVYSQVYDDYVCDMTLNNADGHSLFSSVEGEHLRGQNNLDVTRIQVMDQHAPVIPSVICQQFPNVRDFIIRNSSVLTITPATFSGCRNLFYLNMNFNDIIFLPPRVFPPSLNVLSLYNNRLRDVSFTAFEGTNITQLDLNFNRIDQTYVEIFWPINGTLEHLYMEYNLMYYLAENGLANLRNVKYIDMSGNDFSAHGAVPSNAFVGGENVEILSFTDVGISHLDPEWFISMPNLTVLYLYDNRLTFLPFEIFAPLTNLFALHLSQNHLTELRASSFGTSLRNLWYFYAMSNQINSFQNEILDELQSAQWLMLSENICVDRVFIDVPNNLPMIRSELAGCIANHRQPSINCDYFGGEEGAEYFCIMTINNPEGEAFTAISGEHVSGQTNNDVVVANAYFQNSRTLPGVACTQFPNLRRMSVAYSGVEDVTTASLENCRNLEELYIHENRIRTIRADTFTNAHSLRVLELGYNQISLIEPGAFRGTSLDILDLYNNRLTSFTPDIFQGIGGTLTNLDMSFNRLTSIPGNAFSSLTNLTTLGLSSNPIEGDMPSNAFSGLTNLESLGLARTVLRFLDAGWFTDLRNLRELYLGQNLLREINSEELGPIMPTLRYFYINNNFINLVDQLFLMDDRTPALEYLMLSGNLCVDEDFLNVQTSRWRIFEALSVCTNNFYMDPWLSCTYSDIPDNYMCQISIHNPRGLNFNQIDGNHIVGRNASDVTYIFGMYQNTMVVPEVVCQTFENLRTLRMWNSAIEVINFNSFGNCRNLETLDLQLNWIWNFQPGAFIGNRALNYLELSNNRLSTLPFNAFANAPIEFLDLGFNQLREFSHWSYTSLASTLLTLDLIGNEITQIRPDSFAIFTNLRRLILSNNPLGDRIHRDAFRNLNNLYDLYIGSCFISQLNPVWFNSLPALEQLHINNNNIGELPEGIFRPILRLQQLHMYNNNIRFLNSNQFGQLQSLTHILASINRIRAFDPEIIDRALNLQWLMLSGNICNQDDFSDVQNNRQWVLQRLSTCFFNSGPERLLCNYRSADPDYYCSMTIFNPLGRDNFIEVEGEHVEGRGNGDVLSLYGAYATTLNFPARICEQFNNLVDVTMLNTGIEYIESSSFAACARIEAITLHANLIEAIPDFAFANNPVLSYFSSEWNQIRQIGPFAFFGTALADLDLANNPIVDFDPTWISMHGNTLTYLNLMNTRLTGLPEGAFDNNPNLVSLNLANNPFVDLPAFLFSRLSNLETLVLGNTNLVGLNLHWFHNLTALRNLNLNGNNLFELPAYIFDPLVNLQYLYIYSNNIRDIDVSSLGASVRTLDTLQASYNQIMGIDPTFLDAAPNLQYLYLSSNNCSQENFYDVQDTLPLVRTALDQCFTNFASEFLTCEYFEAAEGGYGCRLTISNPIGRDAFTVVPGTHLPDRTNADVSVIQFVSQNTRNIPAIICQQFPNTRNFIAWDSNIDLITPRSFSACSQLEALSLYTNNINNIPPNAFINNPLLNYLTLGSNRIETLSPQSFEGTAIEFLDLSGNRISTFDPTWFAPINSTLRSLDLLFNQITGLPADAFRSLRDLETLALSNNPLRGSNIPGNAFIALDNLRTLIMGNSELGMLVPQWFTALRSLSYLGLYNSHIETLPNNIFNPLTSLDTLTMNNNFIWEINSGHFGSSLETLRVINLQDNVVNVIDASLITSATSLSYLLLSGNVCSNQDFTNVADYLWITLEYLQQCTDNFVLESTILCEYSNLQADTYMCTLGSHNPRGFDGFTTIPGEHVTDMTNENVGLVYSAGTNMRNIPSIICQQFPNIIELMFIRSNIEIINSLAFQHCRNVQYVFIMENLIRSIPDNTFANSPRMHYLSVNVNRITNIGPNAFRGTAIHMLDLANNRIEVFDPRTYEAINGTLRELDFLNNRLRGFSYAAFETVAGLTSLVLSGNPLTNLPFEFLFPLWDLEYLFMSNCGLTELYHLWFYNQINLKQLHVQNNQLTEFADGVFHNMTNLEMVYFYNNQIRDLRSISFGMSLPSLRILRGNENAINAIDPAIIDNGLNLEYLILNSNLCVDDAFFDVRNNLDTVRTALQGCFNNFETNDVDDDGY